MDSAIRSRTFTLHRFLTLCGFPAAAILLINAAKRAELLPLTPVTQLLAPLAQLLSIALIIAVYATVLNGRSRVGSVGVVIYVGSLAALVGVEFVLNLVFPYLGASEVAALLAGPLGIAFTVSSVAFLVGTLTFSAALWRAAASPKLTIVLIALSTVPIALRRSFPEVVLQIALVGLAAGITLLTVWRLRLDRAARPLPVGEAELVH